MERDSFVFYRNFYEAMMDLAPADMAKALKAVCEYALNGVDNPDGTIAKLVLSMAKPIIDQNNRKFLAGQKGGRPKKTIGFGNENHRLRNSKPNEKENENVNENNIPPIVPPKGGKPSEKADKTKCREEDFMAFWQAYPRKQSRQKAQQAFMKVSVPLETLLLALTKHKSSRQWTEDGGRYIPYAATWLNGKMWEDELQPEKQTKKDPFLDYEQREYDKEAKKKELLERFKALEIKVVQA